MRPHIRNRPEDGASAVEYGLLLAGIAAMIVLVVAALGGATFGLYDDTCTTVNAHVSSSTDC